MNEIEQVLQLLKKGELTEAKKHINRITTTENVEDIFTLAEELLQLGFLEEAKELYEQLLRHFPNEGELLITIAEILIDMDREDEAMLMLEQVQVTDELYPSALILEADLYQMQGIPEVSEQKLLKAKELLPEEVIIDFALGELFYDQGRNQEAISKYIQVIAQREEIGGVNVNLRLAEALSTSGQFEEALPYFEKAIDAKLEINTLFEYGFTAYQAGYYQTAIQKFTELKELDPEYHSMYLYLARSYEHLEELDKALKAVEDGIRADEFNKELYFYGGKLSLKKGNEQAAEKYFKEAIALDPGYLEATITLLKLYMHNERYEDILECIEEVRRYGEDDPQFEWLRAVSLHKTEEFTEALNSYQQAYNDFKNNKDFLEDYGYFLIEEGKPLLASEIFKKLIQLDPTNGEYAEVIDRLREV